MLDLWKDLIPNILLEQIPILEDEKDYTPYMVNRALMAHIDTILYANEMNLNYNLDKRMQYDYLFHSIKKYKRLFNPYLRNETSGALKAVCEYFHCSIPKGKETINILTKEQVKEIVEKVKSKEKK